MWTLFYFENNPKFQIFYRNISDVLSFSDAYLWDAFYIIVIEIFICSLKFIWDIPTVKENSKEKILKNFVREIITKIRLLMEH